MVLIGLGTGIISSFILTLVNTLLPEAINRQSIAPWILPLVINFAIGVMVLRGLMSRKKHPPTSPESALYLVIGAYLALAIFRSTPQVMAQAIIIFPADSEFLSTQMVLIFVDYVLGWVIAVLLGVPAFKLLSLSQRRWVMNWILVAFTLTHLMFVVRIPQARRVISMSNEAFEVLSWPINREAVFSIVAMSALPVLVFLVRNKGHLMPPERVNPVQKRLKKVWARLWELIVDAVVGGYLAKALLTTLGVLIGSVGIELSEPKSYSVHNKSAVISVVDISGRHLHRFAHTTSSGMEARFIVIQKAGSSFGAGLDACEIRGTSDYYEKDGKTICKLYEVAMNIATIGFKGGYNPAPIEYEVPNRTLSVPLPVLKANADILA